MTLVIRSNNYFDIYQKVFKTRSNISRGEKVIEIESDREERSDEEDESNDRGHHLRMLKGFDKEKDIGRGKRKKNDNEKREGSRIASKKLKFKILLLIFCILNPISKIFSQMNFFGDLIQPHLFRLRLLIIIRK